MNNNLAYSQDATTTNIIEWEEEIVDSLRQKKDYRNMFLMKQMAVYASTAKVDGKPLLDIIGTPALTKEEWAEIQTKVTKGGANIIRFARSFFFPKPCVHSIE